MAATLNVTTLVRLKEGERLPGVGVSTTQLDEVLTDLIAEVSAMFEGYAATPFLQAARTEVYDIEPPGDVLYLRTKPVASVASVKIRGSISAQFANVTALDATFYEIESETGILHFAGAFSEWGKRFAEVTYTGGLALNTADLVTNYPDIPAVADIQIAHMLKRRHEQGAEATTITGGAKTFLRELNLLSHVKRALNPYRRWVR